MKQNPADKTRLEKELEHREHDRNALALLGAYREKAQRLKNPLGLNHRIIIGRLYEWLNKKKARS